MGERRLFVGVNQERTGFYVKDAEGLRHDFPGTIEGMQNLLDRADAYNGGNFQCSSALFHPQEYPAINPKAFELLDQ